MALDSTFKLFGDGAGGTEYDIRGESGFQSDDGHNIIIENRERCKFDFTSSGVARITCMFDEISERSVSALIFAGENLLDVLRQQTNTLVAWLNRLRGLTKALLLVLKGARKQSMVSWMFSLNQDARCRGYGSKTGQASVKTGW